MNQSGKPKTRERSLASWRKDPWAGQRKLLAVADVQTGYHHDSISHALASLSMLGRRSGQFVTNIRTDSQLITRRPITGVGSKYGGKRVNARELSLYDALFLLPSGAGSLSTAQQADLLAYVRDDGGGLIVGHAGTLAFFEWPGFYELVGGRMIGEFTAAATVQVEDPSFPGAGAFGENPFPFFEQHPILSEDSCSGEVNVILRLVPETVPTRHRALRTDDDYPVLWSRRFGKGRVLCIGWGHFESTWDNPQFQELVLGGIEWAMGND